jgi:hypothetical protein
MLISILSSSELSIKEKDAVCIKGDRLLINDSHAFVIVPVSDGYAAIPNDATRTLSNASHASKASNIIPLRRPSETPDKATQHRSQKVEQSGAALPTKAGTTGAPPPNKKQRKDPSHPSHPSHSKDKAIVVQSDFQEFDAVSDRGGKLFDSLVKSILSHMKGHPQGVVFSENRLKTQQDKFTVCEKPLRPKDIGRACAVLVDQGHLVHHNGKANCWVVSETCV